MVTEIGHPSPREVPLPRAVPWGEVNLYSSMFLSRAISPFHLLFTTNGSDFFSLNLRSEASSYTPVARGHFKIFMVNRVWVTRDVFTFM